MRTMVIAIVSGVTLSISGAAFADPANTSAAAAAAAPEPMAQSTMVPQATQTESQGAGTAQPVTASGEKLICHHPVHEGTILPQEVCLTKHAWELIRLREQKNVNDWQLHGYQAGIKP
ncbi:MAG TPA: hypothetical protein VHE09_10700 [Rhizomicrobium sp.]|jgi:hypothetical protein|nr:hypothetical protein [Rhizomicrobium sp.]